eukprot:CAMPEP_0194417622 /NCGR_PEP_ID=MMETSP0176-20130528/16740_1 /TAXON_ID=216777 /ORGANISM="Proboscia alata, Strain PI-D3" /LENGTH=109 /DNA_ID=CAMNT_0039223643 /DNA_START=158 /DNA_END=484 /DNA_ORIENTATION=+
MDGDDRCVAIVERPNHGKLCAIAGSTWLPVDVNFDVIGNNPSATITTTTTATSIKEETEINATAPNRNTTECDISSNDKKCSSKNRNDSSIITPEEARNLCREFIGTLD